MIIVLLIRGCGSMLTAGGERDVGGARILPEGSISPGGELCARNGLMAKGLGCGVSLRNVHSLCAHFLFDVLPHRAWKVNSEFHFP
jgi:hypothetical protein